MSKMDYQMAVLLQKQFEHEATIDNPNDNLVYKWKKDHRSNSKSLTDPSWEVIDPTPDIHLLFITFNGKYFWNKLGSVCVAWSKRMTSCAGVCSYQGSGGLCKITLSEPLLKLRPRKDLVETLLHEMIHALLFVTNNNRDRDGHGSEFHKHMYRINGEAGTNISVYHDFHDEVRLYQQHWWRCDGPCQKRKPYFGMVRRATNRAPGRNDFWWSEHQRSCGGKFIKVKEPEKPLKKSNKENKVVVNPKTDIRVFYPATNGKSNSGQSDSSMPKITGFKDLNPRIKTINGRKNSTSTIVITKTSTQPNLVETEKPKVTFAGQGQSLGAVKSAGDYSAVRNHWANKYPVKRPTIQSSSSPKRVKPNIWEPESVTCPICHLHIPPNSLNEHLDSCLEKKCPICDQPVSKTAFDKHVQACISNVFKDDDDSDFKPQELISCLVCDKKILKDDLNAHLDECLNDDIFAAEDPNKAVNEVAKQFNCPVCFKMFSIEEMGGHLDQCLSEDGGDELKDLFTEF